MSPKTIQVVSKSYHVRPAVKGSHCDEANDSKHATRRTQENVKREPLPLCTKNRSLSRTPRPLSSVITPGPGLDALNFLGTKTGMEYRTREEKAGNSSCLITGGSRHLPSPRDAFPHATTQEPSGWDPSFRSASRTASALRRVPRLGVGVSSEDVAFLVPWFPLPVASRVGGEFSSEMRPTQVTKCGRGAHNSLLYAGHTETETVVAKGTVMVTMAGASGGGTMLGGSCDSTQANKRKEDEDRAKLTARFRSREGLVAAGIVPSLNADKWRRRSSI